MKSNVVLKSFQNGISIYMDPDADFKDILSETALKFRESSKFFKNAKMAVSFEGRNLSSEEELLLIDTIHANSYVYIVCIVGKDEDDHNQRFIRAIEQLSYENKEDNQGKFYRGTLKNGQILEVESSIVMIGDVNPGAMIISQKDIIIIGGLYGEAYAGGREDNSHFVVALNMAPERLKIGDYRYQGTEKNTRWPIKPKILPKMASVRDEHIVLEPITKELLQTFSN
ncbi:MAG: septum site-determining protein MinC [Lachnospiraceae bacterium]|nr:septum site-determining protein MinC [Lachnospiraceae bacterium]